MRGSARVQAAARRILDGDESAAAANVLETAVLDDHDGDETFEELGYALAMYAPGSGSPWFGPAELRDVVAHELADARDERGPGSVRPRAISSARR